MRMLLIRSPSRSTVIEGSGTDAAGGGAGVWPDVAAACAAAVHPAGRTLPDPAAAPVYARLYAIYRSLYPALRPAFVELAGPAAN